MFLRIIRPAFLICQGAVCIALTGISGCSPDSSTSSTDSGNVSVDVIHVYDGDVIQAALDRAADSGCTKVVLHEGTYRPAEHGQALIYLNRKHDGIHITGDGDVVLRADNESIADSSAETFPAVVNHVVYFGDGITNSTVLEGVRITGANAFQTKENTDLIQPEIGLEQLAREQFFILMAEG